MTRDQIGAHFEMSQITVLAKMLPEFVGRPVIDETNLPGNYAIRLDFSIEDMRPPPGTPPDPRGPSAVFVDAVEKLGLKLESRKAAIETIIVDHIEKTPTDN